MKPQRIDYDELDTLKKMHSELVIHDKIDLAIDELFDIKYPSKKDSKKTADVKKFKLAVVDNDENNWGEWVYYPWLNKVVHFPPVKELHSLRTSRNRNLITKEEQKKLYEPTILIVGMSVGSNIVEALVSQGIGKTLILVDMDIIEPSNLNRIRSPYHYIGLHKVDAISRKVWEIDPYINIEPYYDGLDKDNLKQILKDYKVDIIIDEMDELRMKIILREQAKRNKIPVIMAADDGDDALIDIERYDIDENQQIFNGRIPDEILEKIKTEKIPRAQLGMMIGKYFVGSKNIPLRMFQSLGEVGKSLPSWPQLGGAAALSGISLSYVAKKIILNHKLKKGRILISLDDKLDLEHLEKDHIQQLTNFQKMLEG